MRNPRLKHYKNRVWDELEEFEAFSIDSIPRELSNGEDALIGSTSLLIPHPDFLEGLYTIELFYWPNVPDNSISW